MYLWQLTNNQQKLVGVADPVSAVCGKALSVGQGDGQHQFQLLFVFQLRNGESDVSQISLKLIFCIGFVKGQCLLDSSWPLWVRTMEASWQEMVSPSLVIEGTCT